MKILFLSPTVPFPLTDGGRIRVFNLLKQIATKSDVTLLALETQPTDADGVAQLRQLGIQVHLIPNAPTLPRVSLSTLVNAFLKRQPITVARYALPAYRQKFRELIATEDFNLVHYEMFHTAQFRTDTDLPGVLSQQNVDSAIWRRLCGETANPFYKFAYWTQQLAFQRYERVLSPKFDAVTCTSDIDAAVFQQHCAEETIEIIPNGVDVTHYQPDFTSEAPAHLIYIGSMDWYPNEDAVAFFADEVLPRIQEKVRCPIFDCRWQPIGTCAKISRERRHCCHRTSAGDQTLFRRGDSFCRTVAHRERHAPEDTRSVGDGQSDCLYFSRCGGVRSQRR